MTITANDIAAWPLINGWHVSPGVPECSAGNSVRLGNGVSLGNDVRLVIADLGSEQTRKYGRCAYVGTDAIARLQAGCHHFTLAKARAHWGSTDYPERNRGDEYLALCDYVQTLCRIQGIPT